MATFGETLKRERELRKITLREVSEATKIGLRYLEAMESNQFDQLPGGVFNKGFIRAYAGFIGLETEALINAYLFDLASQKSPQPVRPAVPGLRIEEAPSLPSPPAETPLAARRATVALGAALVLILAAGAFLITFRGGAPAPVRSSARPARTQRAQIGGGNSEAPAPGDPKQQVVLPSSAPPEPNPSATVGEPAGPPAAQGNPKPEPSVEGLALSLTLAETTSITISCDGTERIRREIPAGDTLALSCLHEIRISTSNAGATAVRINGHECLPLGEQGAEVTDFLIDRERAVEVCPASPRN